MSTTEEGMAWTDMPLVILIMAVIVPLVVFMAWQSTLTVEGPYNATVVSVHQECSWFVWCDQAITARLDNGTTIQTRNGAPTDQCQLFGPGDNITLYHWYFGWYQETGGIVCT